MEQMLKSRFGARVRIYEVDCTPSKVQRPHQEVPYLDDALRISRKVQALSQKFLNEGAFVIVLGGEQTADVGLVAGAAASDVHGGAERRLSVTYLDGHLDCHTYKTSRTKHVHGETLASHVGYGQKDLVEFHGTGRPRARPEDVLLIGSNPHNLEFFIAERVDFKNPADVAASRVVHDLEIENAQKWGIRTVPSDEFKQNGKSGTAWQSHVREYLGPMLQRTNGHLVLCDLDHLHESEAPGVAIRNPDGMTLAQSLQIARDIADASQPGQLMGVAVVECDPQKDIDNKTAKAATRFVEELMRNMK